MRGLRHWRSRPILLGIDVLVLAGALLLFGALAEDVVNGEAIVSFDRSIDHEIHENATPLWVHVFKGIAFLGSSEMLAIVAIATAVAFAMRRWYLSAALVVLATFGSQILNAELKVEFERPRPSFSDPIINAGGFSFPSGHATASIAMYGALAYAFSHHLPLNRHRVWVWSLAALVVLAIGFSRLYLGAHFMTDVLGGYLIGTAWLMLCIVLLKLAARALSYSRAHDRTGQPGARLPAR